MTRKPCGLIGRAFPLAKASSAPGALGEKWTAPHPDPEPNWTGISNADPNLCFDWADTRATDEFLGRAQLPVPDTLPPATTRIEPL